MKNTNFNLIKNTFLISIFVLVLTSCEQNNTSTELEPTTEDVKLFKTPITNHIVKLGFSEKGIVDMGDYYTVAERDVIFDKEVYSYLNDLPATALTETPKTLNSSSISDSVGNKGLIDGVFWEILRYYHPKTGDHFYTIYENNNATKGGYVFEGVEGAVPASIYLDQVPLHRYWNGKDHFYTTNYKNYSGYDYEGIAFYTYRTILSGALAQPFYRYYGNGDHFYTITKKNYSGYRYEGIEGYVVDENKLY